MEKTNICLKEVIPSDAKFLYDLLKNRDQVANISHKKMPNFVQHKKFIMSHPYSKWYIVNYGKRKIGSIYLSKQNEIGIFLKKEFSGMRIGDIVMNLLIQKNPRSRYLANVSPKNKHSQKFFKTKGFKLIQYTYELTQKADGDYEKSD